MSHIFSEMAYSANEAVYRTAAKKRSQMGSCMLFAYLATVVHTRVYVTPYNKKTPLI